MSDTPEIKPQFSELQYVRGGCLSDYMEENGIDVTSITSEQLAAVASGFLDGVDAEVSPYDCDPVEPPKPLSATITETRDFRPVLRDHYGYVNVGVTRSGFNHTRTYIRKDLHQC